MVQRFDELDAERLRELFVQLDAELAGRSEPVTVLVAGGAALAFQGSDRRTHDIDLMGDEFPTDFRRAMATVADRNNLEWNWVNDGATAGNPALEPRPQPLYVGENFAAYSPDERYLSAMKPFSARQRDLHERSSSRSVNAAYGGHPRASDFSNRCQSVPRAAPTMKPDVTRRYDDRRWT